jgi:signal peptidase I
VAAIVVALVIVARLVLGQIAFVSDDSMEPTLRAGERVLVSGWGEPQPGDVVLVQAPEGWELTSDTAFARVIAEGGQRVACCDESGRITVDGVALEESYVDGPTDQVRFDVVVPAGRVFVLSDDRDTARDSRARDLPQEGTVSVDDLLGRATAIVWPPRGAVD